MLQGGKGMGENEHVGGCKTKDELWQGCPYFRLAYYLHSNPRFVLAVEIPYIQ